MSSATVRGVSPVRSDCANMAATAVADGQQRAFEFVRPPGGAQGVDVDDTTGVDDEIRNVDDAPIGQHRCDVGGGQHVVRTTGDDPTPQRVDDRPVDDLGGGARGQHVDTEW